MSVAYRYRDGLAGAPALATLILLMVGVVRPMAPLAVATGAPIEIEMVEPPVERPHEVQPQTPAPIPVRTPAPAVLQPLPMPAPAPLASVPEALAIPEPVRESPRPAAAATVAQEPPPPASADGEAAYVGKLRQMLNAIKRYPTGREASLLRPTGTVRVWLIIDRNGRLLERGIETSSDSILLDNAALRTVAAGNYPAIPAELWRGESQHRFHADLDFVLN